MRMVTNEISFFSYPKINLALDVLGRDSKSGFHLIQTVFRELTEPCDELIFENDPSGAISVASDNPRLPLDDTNTVLKAARLLQKALAVGKEADLSAKKADTPKGAKIFIKKRIPLMSGLGGGSSNAVAALKGLAQLWGLSYEDSTLSLRASAKQLLCHRERPQGAWRSSLDPSPPARDGALAPDCFGLRPRNDTCDGILSHLAPQIGMDCAFFLNGGTAFGEHFGEKITSLPALPSELKFEIIETGVEIFSHWAYSQVDLARCGKNTAKTDALLAAIKAQDAQGILQNLHNDFEEFIFAVHPKLAQIKREIESKSRPNRSPAGTVPPSGRVLLCGSGGALVRVTLRDLHQC